MPATAWTSRREPSRSVLEHRLQAILPSNSQRQPSRTVRSSSRRRAGSARMSITAILPRATVKPITADGCPCGGTTNPAARSRTQSARTGQLGQSQASICRAAGGTAPRSSRSASSRTARAWTWTVSWAVAGSPHASDRATCNFAGQTPASPRVKAAAQSLRLAGGPSAASRPAMAFDRL
jgi:hypothetical protein